MLDFRSIYCKMKGKLMGKLKKCMISKKDKRERTMEEKKGEKHNREKTKKEVIKKSLPLFGCGGRTRTCDLQVMSLASYQLLHTAI